MSDWAPTEIDGQLRRILDSRELAASPKLAGLLEYLTSKAPESGSKGLGQYDIAVDGLGYASDFDPSTNPSVRIMVGRLRRAIRRYYDKSGAQDPIKFRIPKGSYVIAFSVNAEKRDQTLGNGAAAQAELANQSLVPSIAVISFNSMKSSTDDDYIATGLTEEIIIALGRFSKFQVKGPLNRSIIDQEGANLSEIGRRFGTRFILDGTIRSNGASFRLTVRLVDSASGNQVWGEVLDSSLQNGSMLDFDNRVVSRVAGAIADNHGVIPGILLNDFNGQMCKTPSNYEAILRFYHYVRVLSHEAYVQAVDSLERAVRDDGSDATVSGMLSDLIATGWLYGVTDDRSIIDRAENLARKAVSSDPSNQPARFALAMVAFLKRNRARFLEETEVTLQLNPNNANYLAALAAHITMVGEHDRGREVVGRAIELNPHHATWYHVVPFMVSYLEGDYEEAWNCAYKLNTPGIFWDPLIRAAALGRLGRLPEASRAADELLAIEPEFRSKGRELMRRLAFQEETVEALSAGLHQAGLELEPSRDQALS
jgi:adenylate cyclase